MPGLRHGRGLWRRDRAVRPARPLLRLGGRCGVNWSLRAVAELVFFSVWLLLSAWFLAFGSRGRLSARREPFRRPARLRAWAYVGFSACGLIVVLISRVTAAASPALQALVTWSGVALLVLLGVSVLLAVKAQRDTSRAADAYPAGKHAAPGGELDLGRLLPAGPPTATPVALPATRPGGYRVYRNNPQVVVRGLLLLVLAAVPIISMTLYATHLPPGTSAVGDIGAAVFAAVGVILAVAAIRTFRSAITVGADGLVVRSAIGRSQHVPWADVTDFALVYAPRYNTRNSSAVAAAVLRADHQPAYCAGSSFRGPSPQAAQMVQALQAERRSWLVGQQR
jgi:hypothetical protein